MPFVHEEAKMKGGPWEQLKIVDRSECLSSLSSSARLTYVHSCLDVRAGIKYNNTKPGRL